MHVGDNSHAGARRVEAKILVENTHAQSRSAMKKMILEIINKFKKSDYHRNDITREQYENQEAQVVFLFFYNSIQQVDRGLSFCRAIWNHNDCRYPLDPFKADEIVDQVSIKWDTEFTDLSEFISNNELSKGDYLEKASLAFSNVNSLFLEMMKAFQAYEETGNFKYLLEFISAKESEFDLLMNGPLGDGFAPLECEDIDRLIKESEALIHNIWIVSSDLKRDEGNVTYLIRDYLQLVSPKIKYYDYELKKVK